MCAVSFGDDALSVGGGKDPNRGTSTMRHPLVGFYSRTMPRALWWSRGGGEVLLSEEPL
jgi:hypothetical protein